ncbi:hypothetical protein y223_00041 [Bordetella phage PY223]
MGEQKFWLVWCEGKGMPTHKHKTFESAQREAERLARKFPGYEFHVLEWMGACVKPNDVVWRGCDDPFPF